MPGPETIRDYLDTVAAQIRWKRARAVAVRELGTHLEDQRQEFQAEGHSPEEAERLAAEGIDEDYYQRVRRASFGSNLRGLNSFENIAVTLTEGYFHGYDPFRFPQVFDSITKEDVAAFLRDNLTADRAVLSEIVPRER